MSELIEILTKESADARNVARRNYFAAYAVNIITVASSMAATIMVAVKYESIWTAIIAAVPAALLAVNTTFKFENKSSWHWKKHKRINTLLFSLKFEEAKEADVSKTYNQFLEEMHERWEPFGGAKR